MDLKNGYGSILDGRLYGGFVALPCSPLGFGLCHFESFHILIVVFLMQQGCAVLDGIKRFFMEVLIMGAQIVSALEGFSGDLTTVAASALAVGATALLVWIGWRLACKIPNRGAGK